MEIVTPLANALAQNAAITREQSTDKSRQIRRAQALKKDVAAASDTFEHQVESAEELTPIHEEQRQSPDQRRRRQLRQPAADTSSPPAAGIDLTA